MSFDLQRFHRAHGGSGADDDGGAHDEALAELRAGRKTGHWIGDVFPQLDGLGSSLTARRFALRGRAEAEAYLGDAVLRRRLLAATEAVHARPCGPLPRGGVGGAGARGSRVERLMGSDVDALKLVPSLTLFEAVARDVAAADPTGETTRLAALATEVLDAAEAQGRPRCAFTRGRV
jgi:uncharacterized protein (DUF1810 family)